MKSIQQLREQRNEIAKGMRHLIDENPGAKWKDNGCQAAWDAFDAQLVDLDGQITREQRLLDDDAESRFNDLMNAATDRLNGAGNGKGKVVSVNQDRYARWLRGGDAALNAEEWKAIRATMSTDTPSQGGYTVQTDIATTVIDALKAYGGMRNVADVFTTQSGNLIEYPQSNGTAETGEIVGQNAPANALDPSFGTVGLQVYKYGSKIIAIPIELLQDSVIDIEGFVNKRIGTRIGRITNSNFTVGTGVNMPLGLFAAIGTGVIAAAGGSVTVAYDNLIDLQESIDDAYSGPNCKWMMHQTSRKVIRKLKDANGRPIWTPSYDQGIQGTSPDQLLGSDLQINNDAPVMAPNALSIAYGDFSYYKIRDVLGMTMFRFTDSAYASKGQVGFMAWLRSGGAWTDNGGAAKAFQNSAT